MRLESDGAIHATISSEPSGVQDLRSDTFNATVVLPALWAANSSGAVVKDPQTQGDKGLLWVPADGGTPVALPEAFQLVLHWGAT